MGGVSLRQPVGYMVGLFANMAGMEEEGKRKKKSCVSATLWLGVCGYSRDVHLHRRKRVGAGEYTVVRQQSDECCG